MLHCFRPLLFVPLFALLAACGGAATPSGAVPPATVSTQPEADDTALVGTVGPGFTINVQQAGQDVTSLVAGTYTLTVTDAAATHDFTLRAPDGTITEVTDVPFTGTKRTTVQLTPGTWTYLCQPHPSQMNGSFVVR